MPEKNQEQEARQAGKTSRERIAALADGVFAFAMTVLVIDVRVDKNIKLSWNIFPALLSQIESCLLSFLVLGAYWVAHHNLFQHIRTTDRPFLWINILFLTCIAFIPFGAYLVGNFGKDQISVIVYGGILIFTGLSNELLYWYALHDKLLVSPDLDENIPRVAHKRVALPIFFNLLAIGISFFSISISIIIFVLVPVYFIFPSRGDKHWRKTAR